MTSQKLCFSTDTLIAPASLVRLMTRWAFSAKASLWLTATIPRTCYSSSVSEKLKFVGILGYSLAPSIQFASDSVFSVILFKMKNDFGIVCSFTQQVVVASPKRFSE